MTLAGTMISEANREQWLAERRNGLGSSDAAAALGVSPYTTALELYLSKLGLSEPFEGNEATQWGLRLEPLIAEVYGQRTGYSFSAAQPFLRSLAFPWMSATLDRVRSDGRIVELKTVGSRSAHLWGEAGTDEVPVHYLAQVHHQMIVAGAEVCDVAALIGGQELRIYEVQRDDEVAEHLIATERSFWQRVLDRDPPPIDYDRDGPVLARLWPEARGEVELDEVSTELVRLWEVQGRMIGDLEKARRISKAQILEVLNEAASARLADGRVITRKVTTVDEQQFTRKSYSFVDLRLRKGKGD